jgi:hypothetical protein
MNYKIRITAENQAIVKRIADENGMNPNCFNFNETGNYFFIFPDGNFREASSLCNGEELSTEQFIELFDKKETELEKWLKETKAKNLSLNELEHLIFELENRLFSELKGSDFIEKAEFLFNQWNNPTEESPKVETEWQPKRGDRVLVWDDDEEPKEKIYLTYSDGERYPYRVVLVGFENEFKENKPFESCAYQHMKPLPIEQPKETDFKSKVIELIEKRHELLFDEYKNKSAKLDELKYILNQIKQL